MNDDRNDARLTLHWIVAGLGAALLGSAPALAQTEPAPAVAPYADAVPVTATDDAAAAADQPVKSRMIEEVLVTAQKREEAIQDVPIAIQAFSAEMLDARGVASVVDLQSVTPGLTITSVSTLTNVYLRGVGSDAFIPSADPSVGMYLDGIYQPFSPAVMQNFGAIKRIEVLKGPQGTLFGRNSTGGAINVISDDPSGVFQASAEAGIESYETRRLKGSASGPLTDTLSASVSVVYNEGESYYDFAPDSPTQSFALDELDRGIRVKLRWEPIESFDLTLTGFTVHSEGGTSSVSVQDAPAPVLGPLLGIEKQSSPPWVVSTDRPIQTLMDNSLVYLVANWRPQWMDIKFLASDQRTSIISTTDYDGSPVALVSFSPLYGTDKERALVSYNRTAELQLLSNKDGWMSEQLQWIAGLYYIEGDQGFGPIYLQAAGLESPLRQILSNPAPLPGSPQLPEITGLLTLFDQLRAEGIDPGAAVQLYGLLDTVSYAGYTQATYSFTEKIRLTLGARYSVDERDLYRAEVNARLNSGEVLPLTRFDPDAERQSNFSPKVSFDIKPYDDVLVYASWQRGFKSGTFNCVNILVSPEFVKPETLTAMELGVKSDLFNRRLRLNAAVFDNRIDDLQVQFISLISGGVTSLENAASAKIRGAEFEATWAITPALVLTTAATVLDATYEDYESASGYDTTTGFYRSDYDFSGNRITRTPKRVVQAGLSYTMNVPGGTLEIAGDGAWNSGYYFDAQNVTEQNAFRKYDARLSYFHDGSGVRVTAFGRNLTDARIFDFKYLTDFGVASRLAPPHVYGLRISKDF